MNIDETNLHARELQKAPHKSEGPASAFRIKDQKYTVTGDLCVISD